MSNMRKSWLYSSSPLAGGAVQTCGSDLYQLFRVSHCVGVFCLCFERNWKSIQLTSDRGILTYRSGAVGMSGFWSLVSSYYYLLLFFSWLRLIKGFLKTGLKQGTSFLNLVEPGGRNIMRCEHGQNMATYKATDLRISFISCG